MRTKVVLERWPHAWGTSGACVKVSNLAAAPVSELGDEDHVDLAGLGERQDLLAFGALVLGPGGRFFPDAEDLVAGFFRERSQVSLLAAQV
jgi:hypothetical protein